MEKLHGGNIYDWNEAVIDLSANINPLGVCEEIRRAVESAVYQIDRYPDVEYRRLRKAVAEWENVNEDWILCGNGAADLIFQIMFSQKPRRVLLAEPGFLEYELAARAVNAEIDRYRLKESRDFILQEDVIENVTKQTGLVILCNPNNPTGKCVPQKIVTALLEKCRICDALLVMDECFLDFVEDGDSFSLKESLRKYPEHLMILKAFTKIFAIPGLRIGYLLTADESLREKIERVRQPWSVSVVAEKAAIAACTQKDFPEKTRQYIKKEKAYLYGELRKFQNYGLTFLEGEANFIFLINESGLDLKKELLKEKLLIRDCENFFRQKKSVEKDYKNRYYRIAVRTREENKRLIAGLNQVFDNG